MSTKYKIRNQEKLYFVTFTVINWIDVFTKKEYRNILLDSIKYCQDNKGLEVYAYCIMSNHIHLIVRSAEGKKLQDIIRDLKKFTSVKIVETIEQNERESRKSWMLWMFARAGQKNSNNKIYQFWQQHSHPIELSDNVIMLQKLEYIHQNPVKAGIVVTPEEYLYSSARNYAGYNEYLLEVNYIE